jgi:TonB family protein
MKTAAKADPWLFDADAVFPVVGETHPLKKHYRDLFYRASITAMSFHLLFFGGWLVGRNLKPKPQERSRSVQVVSYREMGVPPSIAQNNDVAQVTVAAQVAPPSIGVPEPVPDFQAQNTSLATTDQLAEALSPVDVSSLDSGGDSLVVDASQFGNDNPSPDDFVAVEEMPVMITPPQPVYPEMARAAEVEGVVTVRGLVTKEGKIGDAFVTDGHPMLNDAAIAAVKKAVFKPALQQHKPVAVWVQIPIRFSLH